MGGRQAKDALYAAFALVAKALGNGRRAELVDVLNQGERTVDALAASIGQSVANTSQHLQVLLAAGLVTTRRDGNRVFYSLAGDEIGDLWLRLRGVAERHVANLDALAADYLGDRESLEQVSHDELRRRLASGDVVVLDVRPADEFQAGHIAGATSLPIADLADRIAALPRDVSYVAYCRGPYCVMADDAVRLLADAGLDAARLEGGYPEWVRTLA